VAFGFGGINGHVLIEEWRPESFQKQTALRSTLPFRDGFKSD